MDEIEEKVMVEIEQTLVEDLLTKKKRLDAVIVEITDIWREGVGGATKAILRRILKIAKGESDE